MKPKSDHFNMDVMKETDLLCYLRLKKKRNKRIKIQKKLPKEMELNSKTIKAKALVISTTKLERNEKNVFKDEEGREYRVQK